MGIGWNRESIKDGKKIVGGRIEMSMTFNEFNRQLQNRNIDRQTAYMLAVLFEVQLEQGKQLDACASVLTQLVETVQQFTALHEATQGRLNQLRKDMTGEVEGVTVASEPYEGSS